MATKYVETYSSRVTPKPELPKKIKIIVNGELFEFVVGDEIKPNMTLWELLREKLGYTSVKEMCLGEGACGSCTVILNNRPVLSCMTLVTDCDGGVVETAEGIAKAGHPIIEAWAKHYAFQCGYCTPGAVVTAKALLDRNKDPTDEEIIEALGGNICRCTTYPRWLPAVKEAAEKFRR
jgi:aerobic-type carbon monoxide dehydrogenase small subunit (CoxS/CutS family)